MGSRGTAVPVALYAVPPNVSEEYRQTLDALINDSDIPQWVLMADEGSNAGCFLQKGCAEAAVQS